MSFTRGLRLRPSFAFRTSRASAARVAPQLSPEDLAFLRDMAKRSGWAERGGQLIRKADRNANRWEKTFAQGRTGEVSGRTNWVGRPEWARGIDLNPEQLSALVEKALAGKRLGPKQAAIWEHMLLTMADFKAP